MSKIATDYVMQFDRRVITRRQKALLLALASEHSERYESAHLDLETLESALLVNRRWLQRLIRSVEKIGLIEYTPGHGQGNCGCFIFPKLSEQYQNGEHLSYEKRWSKGGQKVVKRWSPATPPIRKEPKPTPNPEIKREAPARFSQSDFDERDLRLMGQALRKLMEKPSPEYRRPYDFMDEAGILRFQCEFAGISLERGAALQEQTRTMKKAPQSA